MAAASQLRLPMDEPAASARGTRPARRERASVYEAASHSRRTVGWHSPTTFPNQMLWNLTTLRDRSRHAVRNDGYAKGIIDKLVSNIVGTGIKPLSRAEDANFRKDVQALWLDWTDFSDADGLLDWYGQESQAVRCWLEAGEVFVRIRQRLPEDELPVPLQVQVLEPEMCPLDYNSVSRAGNPIRAGIEFDRIGRRVAYYFFVSRPGDLQDVNVGDLRRVPAESVSHVFLPLRAGQLRGLPHLTQALIKLYELDKFDDATLLRVQLSNLFVAFLKKGMGDGSNLNPLTGLSEQQDAAGRDALQLRPGIFQELDPGEEVDFSEPPDAGSNYVGFVKQQLMSVAAAVGVPYEVLTGDMSGLNDRVMRVILHEFRRQIQTLQHQVVAHQLCRPVWRAWMDRVFLSEALPIPIPIAYAIDPTPWLRVDWKPQIWPYIHPVQDVQATREAIRAGLTSRSAVVSEQGEDSEQIDDEQAADNVRADELGLSYESDGRKGASANPAAPPAADPDQEDEDPENPDQKPQPMEGDRT